MRSVAQHYQVVPDLGPSFLTFDLKLCSGTCVLLHEVGSDAHCCCVKCYETCLCWVNGDRVAVVPVPALWLTVHTGTPAKLGPGDRHAPYLSTTGI